MEDLAKLEGLGRPCASTSLCGLGQTAPNPVLSTLTYFQDEYWPTWKAAARGRVLWRRQGEKGGGPLGITLTIDGQQTQVPEGTTIFNAARELGITVPHLCYHPMLSVIGACRLCIVEVEGLGALSASCSTPVKEGMVVATESARVIEPRRQILDLLLANHPEDCLTCEKTGDCRLQAYAYRTG